MDSWILTAVTFVPLLGAVIAMAMPNDDDELHKRWALAVSLVALGLGIAMLFDFNYDQAGQLQWVVDEPWIDVIGAGYTLGVDGMSLPLIALTVLVMPLVFLYSWNHIPSPGNTKSFLILMLILETGMIGTFVAQDLILFFVFFEVVLLPMFFMIAVWGGDDRRYASLKFFLYTLFGSALMLLGFLALFFLAKDPVTGEFLRTFDMRELTDTAGAGIARGSQLLIFGGMFIGFGVKVPMFPFHTWLPDAHTQAPTQGSVILAAVLLKLGTYGFIRISIPMLPEAAEAWAPVIGLLAVIGIIYGALGCLAQTDMKRLIALVGGAHGVRDARHLDPHRLRHQRRHLRHGCPWSHHRHAVLHRRLGEGPLSHPRDQPSRRHAHPGAAPRLDSRLYVDGVARPARSRRLLG